MLPVYEPVIVPSHIAIIMDGNGRWAQQRGLSRSEGHKAGVKVAKEIVNECRRLGIKWLTLYTFSVENWGRPKDEIRLLFQLLVQFLSDELPNMVQDQIRLRTFGNIEDLPLLARKTLLHALDRTKDCKGMTVNLALSYSGRAEILRAVRNLITSGIKAEELTEDRFRAELYSYEEPDPDLIIRTSGEMRLSNYLLYQSAYSELYFTDTYWPDFSPEELHKALDEYSKRDRRFGLI